MAIKQLLTHLVLAATLVAGCRGGTPPKEAPGPAAEQGEGQAGLVAMPAESQKLVALQTAKVAYQQQQTTLATTGEVTANPDLEAHVTTRVAGRVLRILKSVGDPVGVGDTLATLESVELGQAQADFLQADARHELAVGNLERQRTLFASNVTAKKEVQAAENAVRMARIDRERSANQLKLLGYTTARTARLARLRDIDPVIPLTAPVGGTIITKHLTVGEMLEPDAAEPAFIISNISKVWINADIYEKDLPRIHEGQQAAVTTTAYPGKTYRGVVSRVSAALEKETRTAKARVVVDNADRRLKPEMFANVRIDVGRETALVVPKAAVQEEAKQKIVYVPAGPDKFREVQVKLGREYADGFEVLAGLKAGDPVVTHGSFDLLAQARKGTFGGED